MYEGQCEEINPGVYLNTLYRDGKQVYSKATYYCLTVNELIGYYILLLEEQNRFLSFYSVGKRGNDTLEKVKALAVNAVNGLPLMHKATLDEIIRLIEEVE